MSYSFGKSIVTDGLVFYVDAANENSYPGSGTTWFDLIGENDGTFEPVAGPTYDSANGGSIAFDGADDGVVLANNSVFYLTPNQDQTNCGWFSTDNTSTSTIIYDARNVIGAVTKGYFIGVQNNGTLRAWFYYDLSSTLSLKLSTSISQNTWYYYSVVFNRTGLMSLYLNGTLEDSVDISPYTNNDYSINTNPNIGIKSYSGSGVLPFNGNISNVSIYNRALSSTEILQNYNALKNRFI